MQKPMDKVHHKLLKESLQEFLVMMPEELFNKSLQKILKEFQGQSLEKKSLKEQLENCLAESMEKSLEVSQEQQEEFLWI